MKPHEKRDLIRKTANDLIWVQTNPLRNQKLTELLEDVWHRKLSQVLLPVLMMIRGSKIDDTPNGIVALANTIKAEEGYNDTFQRVAEMIDAIPDETPTRKATGESVAFPSQGKHPAANRLEPVGAEQQHGTRKTGWSPQEQVRQCDGPPIHDI